MCIRDSYVYVANFMDVTVSVIQTVDNTVIATVTVGAGAFGVAISPNGNYVYVTRPGADTVSVIQTSDNTIAPCLG